MKINQLFKNLIPYELLLKLILCFGYTSIDDDYSFCKNDLEELNSLEKINEIKDELLKFYLQCKAKIYLNKLDYNKIITIFRQILRLHNLILVSKQKYIKQKKTTFYFIQKKIHDKNQYYFKIDNEIKIINFT